MDAETKRYIDQQIYKLKKELLYAISNIGNKKGAQGPPGELELALVEEDFYGTILKIETREKK